MPARNITGRGAGWVGKDHDRKFEPLRPMYGHHPNAFGALLDDRRVFGLPGFCVGIHALHEGAERGRAALFEPPRQVDHPQAVGQRLLASWPHRNARMRPNRVQQHQYRLCDWAAVASHMEAAQQSERIGDFLGGRLELIAVNRMHRMQSAYLQLTVGAESIADRRKGHHR